VQNYGLKGMVQHFPVFAVFATSKNQSFRALIRWIEPFWAIGKKTPSSAGRDEGVHSRPPSLRL
jgi:hypothetical protein